MHTEQGREFLNSISTKTEKAEPMNRSEELLSIAKNDGGMAMIAKQIIDNGETSFSEMEISAALMEFSKQDKNRRAGESAVSAYARHIETNAEFRTALGIAKGYRIRARKEGDGHAVEKGYDAEARLAAGKQAYEKLVEIGEQQYPDLEPAAAFVKAFEHNPRLAKASRDYSIDAADDADGTGSY
jgi:hypothetical protein